VVTIVFFVAVTVAGMIVGAQDRDWMDSYATTLSAGALAAMAPATVDWTKAVIPIVVIVGAIGMTQFYPDRAGDKARALGAV
jgi:hypothetical protein